MSIKGKELLWSWAMALLAAIALGLCIVLTVHSSSGAALLGCAGGSSCDTVLSSAWSHLFGVVPVSIPGAGMYLALLVCCLFLGRDAEMDSLVEKAMVVLASAILFACLWFIVLQVWKVKAFCPWCMATHCVGIVLSLLVLLHFRPVRRGATAVGFAAALSFALLQLFTTPASRFDRGETSADLPVASAGVFPVIGDPSAPVAVELLFDYQCPHCREVHAWAAELASKRDICFVLCPTPLSQACNPYIQAGVDAFWGSCDLAKMALALWTLDKDAFREFDSWLFSADGIKWHPRSVEAAREKALSLVGAGRLDPALQDSRINEWLGVTLEIFGRTTTLGHSGIPRLVYGQSWLIPDAATASDFARAVEGLCGINFE